MAVVTWSRVAPDKYRSYNAFFRMRLGPNVLVMDGLGLVRCWRYECVLVQDGSLLLLPARVIIRVVDQDRALWIEE